MTSVALDSKAAGKKQEPCASSCRALLITLVNSKWCLCASRWREAFEARKSDDDKIVPKIFLNATNQSALKKMTMEELQKFAVKE
jgi:uncharacterized protein (DUF2237 family)